LFHTIENIIVMEEILGMNDMSEYSSNSDENQSEQIKVLNARIDELEADIKSTMEALAMLRDEDTRKHDEIAALGAELNKPIHQHIKKNIVLMEKLDKANIILNKIVTASDDIRAYNDNEGAELAYAQEFGLAVVKILKEYLGDEY
jgi:transposase